MNPQRLKIAVYIGEFLEAVDYIEQYVADITGEFGTEFEVAVCRNREEFDREIEDADIVVCWTMRPETFARAKKLRWIAFGSAGLNHTMFPALQQSDVILTTMSGVHTQCIPEHVFCLILTFARRMHRVWSNQQVRLWDREPVRNEAFELLDKKLGLIGFGKIGRRIAEIGAAIGMRILVLGSRDTEADDWKRAKPPHEFFPASRRLDFVSACDFLVIAAPQTSETEGMIGAPELEAMKNTAYLINVARGRIVDEPALGAALARGGIAGAGLDVFWQEPLPPDHPFWTMENVIITPHVAGSTPEYWMRASEIFSRNLGAFLSGGEMENVYDRRKGY
jgi:D-2-hydroxyacid dehydrogenase (NADP+)